MNHPNVNKLTDGQLKEVSDIVGAYGCRVQTIHRAGALHLRHHRRRA